MLNLERNWFATVTWETVIAVNKELCQKDEQPHEPNPKGYEVAKALWEKSVRRPMKFRDALEVFRQTHKLAPFRFFNGNTVAAVVKLMVGEMLEQLPPVQAQIARSTVSHFVVGAVKLREVEDVFKHFGEFWKDTKPRTPDANGAV